MRFVFGCLIALALARPGFTADSMTGRILSPVSCTKEPAQTYALYVPSNYSRERKWPVIFCFDPGGRGRTPVERLQAAAEKYGYIVAGSLTSRNGPWAANAAAIQAMVRDVESHLLIDVRRIYAAGLSGGARVATQVALGGLAKGVIACSAGFPASEEGIPGKVPFVFFGTAGTDDFNHGELWRLDGELESRKATHRIVFFNGGHEWASVALLTEAVEWLELQAMRAGTRAKDDAFVASQWQVRYAAVPNEVPIGR
jgi:predicted esterase